MCYFSLEYPAKIQHIARARPELALHQPAVVAVLPLQSTGEEVAALHQ